MRIRLTEEIWKEGNMYVSYCPELDIAACGGNVQKTKNNLKEVILINLEETKKMGTFDEFMKESGIFTEEGDILYARKELVGFTPIEFGIS